MAKGGTDEKKNKEFFPIKVHPFTSRSFKLCKPLPNLFGYKTEFSPL